MVVTKLLIRPYFVGGCCANENLRPTSQCPENVWRRKNIERKTHQPFLEGSKKPLYNCFGGVISQPPANFPAYVCSIFGVGGAGLPYAILAAIKLEKHLYRNTWDQTLIQKKWTSIWNLKSYKSKPLDSRDLSLDFLQSPSSLLPLKM